MGIHNFLSYIDKHYPDIYTLENDIDIFYFDLTYILHLCMYRSKNVDDLILKISNILVSKIEKYSPTEIIVALDGIPCLSKIKTECIRRKNMVDDGSFCITTGTKTFSKIKERLITLMNEISTFYEISVEMLFENYDEAEFKILRNINSKAFDKKIGFYTNDSDVILMSLINKHSIYLIHPDTKNFININKLKEKFKNPIDFMLISILMGNDYLPKMNFTTFENIFKTYNEFDKQIVINDKIDPKNFQLFLFKLTKNMNQNFIKKFNINDYNPKKCEDYLNGLCWCITNYIKNDCHNLNYIYKYNSINAKALLIYLQLNEIKYPHDEININVDEKIYPYIILPKSILIKELDCFSKKKYSTSKKIRKTYFNIYS